MYKAIGFTLAAGLLFLGAGVASAATITNVEFSNGDTTYSGKGGSTVNAKFRITVPAGEVVEWLETDVISDGLAPVCERVGGSRGLEEGTHSVSRSIKLPPNTGWFDIDTRTSGIFGGVMAVDCDDSGNGSDSFGSVLRVVSNSSNSGDDDLGGTVFGMSFDQFLAALKAALGIGEETANPAYCASIGSNFFGQSGAHVSAVQNTLIMNGFALGYGATGYW